MVSYRVELGITWKGHVRTDTYNLSYTVTVIKISSNIELQSN